MMTIDPGVHACGWAEWYTDRLIRAGFGTPDIRGHASVVVEMPQADARSRRVRLQDVLDLAYAAGAAAGTKALKVHPRDWKGNVPKRVMARRVLRTLDPEELGTLHQDLAGIPKELHHNVWDAVGIGLWHLGRLR